MSNTQKFNPNSLLPIFSEAIFMGTMLKNKECFAPESYSTMMKTNALRLMANTATISSGIYAASVLTDNMLAANPTLDIINLSLGTGIAITGIVASKFKGSKYQETVKKIQNELTKDFRVKFDLKTFEDLDTGENFTQIAISNQLLNMVPIIGVNKFTKACNRWIKMGTKHCFEYMKAKYIDINNDTIRKIEKDYKDTNYGFIEDLYDINSKYNRRKIEIIKQDGATIQTTLLEKHINENMPKKLSKKAIIEELNGNAIIAGYEKTLVQDTQLAFVNSLRFYAKERMSATPNDENLKKYRDQIDKFSNLYQDTNAKKGKDIPEYKAIEDTIKNIDNFNSFSILERINSESFEETTQNLNENLSDGKNLYLRTLKDNILRHRNSIMLNKREEEIDQDYVSKSSPIKKVKVEIVSDDDFIAQLGVSKVSIDNKEYKRDKLKNRF
jgi:hypothetical protein